MRVMQCVTGVGVVLAMLCSVAAAADYVVARSSQPSIVKGTQLAAGQLVALGAGGKLTLISAGGDILVLRGAEGGVRLPALAAGPQTASIKALTALVERPSPRRNFGAMRGKAGCPDPATLTTMPAIMAAAEIEGCGTLAKQALDRLVLASETADTASEPGAMPAPPSGQK